VARKNVRKGEEEGKMAREGKQEEKKKGKKKSLITSPALPSLSAILK